MNCENHLEKKAIQKIVKLVKNQSEIAVCEQKTISEKANFCSTPFCHSTLKLERKNSPRKTTHFCAPLPVSA